MHDTLPCVLAWDFWTPNLCCNYRSKYKIVTEYRCIAMRLSTHFVWIKAAQQFIGCYSPKLFRYTWSRHRIIALPLIAHSSLQTCGKDSCQTGYDIYEFNGLRNWHDRRNAFWESKWIFFFDRQYWKCNRTMNINKQPASDWHLTLTIPSAFTSEMIRIRNLDWCVYWQHTVHDLEKERWLFGDMVDHVGIYGSKAAEGVSSCYC